VPKCQFYSWELPDPEKCSFIQRVTQNEDVRSEIRFSQARRGVLLLCSFPDPFLVTQTVEMYRLETSTTEFLLIDTPGFNDTWLTDRDVLDELASWLS
jgi:hypothetical protein